MEPLALRRALVDHVLRRARRSGLVEADLTDHLDLVRSGVLDSLGFVDLLGELESTAGMQVDLERTLGTAEATTVRGILSLFERP